MFCSSDFITVNSLFYSELALSVKFTGFISNPIFIIMCKFGVVECDGKGQENKSAGISYRIAVSK